MTDPAIVDAGTVVSVAGLLHTLAVLVAGTHVLLNKQNEISAFAWLGIIVLSPGFGVALYWLFGINRIRRRAQAERPAKGHESEPHHNRDVALISALPDRWQGTMRLGMSIHDSPYLDGNHIVPLVNGDEGYPRMLEAIETAEQSVVLSSYIFTYDTVGTQFVEALVKAHARGIKVRVLIDGFGVGYGLSLARADKVLRAHGVKTARFLSAFSSLGTRFINLRNHRKILSIDGRVAYIGGLNIRANNVVADSPTHPTQDLHFEVVGPVIDQINAVFAEDWYFAAREQLNLPPYADGQLAQAPDDTGEQTISRVLVDGPDDNYQKLELTIVSAANAARSHIGILTPYFLPQETVLNALKMAALRGVLVELIVPEKNNLPFVDWAMRANEPRLQQYGVRIYRSPSPFDHSKLFIVDDQWALIGSSNWDARSLKLNFEINLECYDTEFNNLMRQHFMNKRRGSRVVDGQHQKALPVRLRNNFFRLFSPYL